ncbi:MAG: hypothetical protein ACTHNW_13515 [Mucilaginibacter sp.]
MSTYLQKGQKVITPDGPGLIEEVYGEKIVVKLDNGECKEYQDGDIVDDSNAG